MIGVKRRTSSASKQETIYSTNSIKFIDLFAGMGGIRIGFENGLNQIGIKTECVFSSEIKKHATEAYKNNFNNDYVYGDITKINVDDIASFDFLLAGFPCQPFSSAGNRLGFKDTTGTLFFEIQRILENKKPYGFLLENVEGLINHDNGSTLNTILLTLKELGYKVSYKLIDALDFGLAQSRKRVYIVGTKDTEINLDNFEVKRTNFIEIQEHNKDSVKSDFVQKLLSHYPVDQLYGKSIKDKRGGDDNIHSWDIEIKGIVSAEQKHLLNLLLKEGRKKIWADQIGIKWMDGMPLTLCQIKTFYNHQHLNEMLDDLVTEKYLVLEHPKQLVNNKRVYDITKPKGYNIITGKLSFEFSKILDPRSYTPTLVATDVEKLGVIDHNGIRRLTLREDLRLFGFPETYNIDFLKYKKEWICLVILFVYQ
ncbi:DNA (cytosine-5-)-methyltransferase [Ureaplasma diversum]|uniref:Cytosine-specific methyltransferase n=1 Tax=Ureaplasma diversum NCTC 246 TaxID=1188241 RepID=A0A084F0M7_9BACT|nr:DNA (cytosine-5-)-methyltransferase [Ureaplasma diversum]KEZ23769.1 Type II restriction modification system cytosine-5 DNA methyltransferase [Ureaplasma diversum NCTC 246]